MAEDQPTIFDKIVNGSIPCKKVYEDDLCLAFHDVNPQAPVHVILIPKVKNGLSGISKAEERHKEIIGHLGVKVREVADILGLGQGYRVVINEGTHGGQTVAHLHIHILGGTQLFWPPGTPGPGGEGMEKK